MSKPVLKILTLYGLLLAAAAFALEWLQYKYFTKSYSTEIYVLLIATIFAGLGIWVGHKLTTQKPSGSFEENRAAIRSLGISDRELEVLKALAAGQSNKEIGQTLNISPNTVKTHVARLYAKLQVNGRIKAIEEARSLHLLP